MSWCTAAEVASLLCQCYCSLDASVQRSAADATLRQYRSTAINYGDVLSEIVGCDDPRVVSVDVRFAAAMQLEGMTSATVWNEGTSFSDKPMVTQTLLSTLQSTPQTADKRHGKLIDTIASCLSRIAALEFGDASKPEGPSPPPSPSSSMNIWQHQIASFLDSALHGVTISDYHRNNIRCFLLKTAKQGRTNTSLWKFLANDCSRHLLLVLDDGVPSSATAPMAKEFAIRMVASLSSKTPIDPQVFSSFIFSNEFLEKMTYLQQYVRLEDLWTFTDVKALQDGCDLKIQLLTVMMHAPKRENTHRPLLESTILTLTSLGEGYLGLVRRPTPSVDGDARALALTQVITEMLELVQSTLDALPDAFQWLNAHSVFTAFLWFMVDDEAEEESSDEERLLCLMDGDESTLAGCGAGSPKAVASSIIQLFLESEPDAAGDFLKTWIGMAESLACDAALYWGALSSVLVALCRQCASSSTCLLDFFDDQSRGPMSVLRALYSVLHSPSPSITPYLKGKVLYLFGRMVQLTCNAELCGTLLSMLLATIESEGQKSATATVEACMALQAAGAVLTCSNEVCAAITDTLPPTMMECALWVSSSAGPLGAYCGGNAISILLDISTEWSRSIWGCGRLCDAVSGVIANCTSASAGQTLTKLLKALVDGHFEVTDGSRCAMLQRIILIAQQTAVANRNCSSIVVRCLFEVMPQLMQTIATNATGGFLTSPMRPSSSSPLAPPVGRCSCNATIEGIVQLIAQYGVSEGPHDDSTIRGLCTCLGTAIAVGIQADVITEAAITCFQEATSLDTTGTTGATLTSASLCIAVAAMASPMRFFTSASFLMYVSSITQKRAKLKDFNMTGSSLFPALCCTMDAGGTIVEALYTSITSNRQHEFHMIAEFVGHWASMIAFADRRTQLYTIIGWQRLVEYVFSNDPSQSLPSPMYANRSDLDFLRSLLLTPSEHCTFRKLRSLHEKAPKNVVPACSILQAMILGLAEIAFTKVFTKLSSFTMHVAFDPLLSPNRHHMIVGDGAAESILTSTSSEGSLKTLDTWRKVVQCPQVEQWTTAAIALATQ